MEKVVIGIRITLYRALKCIHRKLELHHAVSLRQHGFSGLILAFYRANLFTYLLTYLPA